MGGENTRWCRVAIRTLCLKNNSSSAIAEQDTSCAVLPVQSLLSVSAPITIAVLICPALIMLSATESA